MLRLLCCCCFSGENSGNERQPLLQPSPSEPNGAESVRQMRPAHSDANTVRRTGRLVMRRVCVPELDQRFSDMAEIFNEQQARYESMVRHISTLRQSGGCTHDGQLALSECVGKIRDKHGDTYRITLQIKGYDFSLSVIPIGKGGKCEEMSPDLQFVQDEMKCTSESTKATISKGTTLQELIGWLLRSKDQMTEQVKRAAETYQEQRRLIENLEENLKEVRRAKELSLKYRQQAGEVLSEAAQIAGAYL